jgi:hypothetical protein
MCLYTLRQPGRLVYAILSEIGSLSSEDPQNLLDRVLVAEKPPPAPYQEEILRDYGPQTPTFAVP